MNSSDFLTAMWGEPPPGLIQTWELRNRRSSYWARASAANVDGQSDVFCAVGTSARRLGASHRAKADEICALAGVFLDIDVKPGGCPTRNDAFALSSAHLSPTIVVDSGYGLHCHYWFPQPWVFRTISERERAKIIVQQFVALHQRTAAEKGWAIDSVGDLARLLRVPGTFNAKDPGSPRPVIALGLDPASGPRYTYSEIALHLKDMPIVSQQAAGDATAAVDLRADATDFEAKLDALLENSPEFRAVWEHQRKMPDDSPSSYDMSLCNLAAGAMNDGELRALIQAHRAKWADWCAEHDTSERRPVGYSQAKGRRESYLVKTIASARRAEQRARLDNLGRRQAA